MNKMAELLKGKKTVLVAAVTIILAIAQNFIYIPNWVFEMLLGTGALTLRDAINNLGKDSKAIIDAAEKK